MSDELEEITADATSVADGETGKGLRSQLEAANSELKRYKNRALDDAFAKNGLTREAGMGKAIDQIYEGDPTPEALSTFLIDYGYEYQGEGNPLEHQMSIEQAKLDQVSIHAGSISAPTPHDELQSAEARGDYQKSLQMKSKQMESWFQGPQ